MSKCLSAFSFLIGLIATDFAYAQSYQMYRCSDTNSCSGQCSPLGRSVVFLTNKAKSIVMAQFHEGGQFKTSDTFENCKVVFNDKNWDCSSQVDHANGFMLVTIKMTNGIYQARTTSFNSTPTGLASNVLVDVCAR